MSKFLDLMRECHSRTSVESGTSSVAEIVRLLPGVKLGQAPLWVDRAVIRKTPPKVLSEVFPLGHTDYFIYWDKRTYSWYFCAEIGFGKIVPLASVDRRRYHKRQAIEAFFYVWWRKFRIENDEDGDNPCPFQINPYVKGINFDAILDEIWRVEADGSSL